LKEKNLLVVLLAASIACAAIMLLVVSRINDARIRLTHGSPGSFNYLLQADHNLDSFVYELNEYRLLGANAEAATELRAQYRRRFDVIWGTFTVFEIHFPTESEHTALVTQLVDDSKAYLTRHEPSMQADYQLSEDEVRVLIDGARQLSDQIKDIAHRYFIYASQLQDLWTDKLNQLYRLFWFFALTLVVAGGLLIGMLLRSSRRSAAMAESSHKTQRELSRLVDELRSGKLERKAKDSFIAAASHDLRQPLHALGLFLGATEKHVRNEEGRDALDEAKRCAAELNKLFNSLLDLSRLDAGVVEVNKNDFELGRLLHVLEQELSVSAVQGGVEFAVEEDHGYVYTDALLFSRIIRNLVDNALIHSGASAVKIVCQARGEHMRVTVSDDGSGIPVHEHAEIFSEYYQLKNPERDRSKGLGLGLSIVKRLCNLLDIDVSMESGIGAGTSFHLDVPIGHEIENERHTAVHTTPDLQGFRGALIAVIDDEANIRRGMDTVLRGLDFKTISAESANMLITKLRRRGLKPDLLIADYRLRENQTGDVAIHRVRAAMKVDFPAMIITGDTSPARVHEASSSGFELLHKPVEPEALLKVINRLLGESRQQTTATSGAVVAFPNSPKEPSEASH